MEDVVPTSIVLIEDALLWRFSSRASDDSGTMLIADGAVSAIIIDAAERLTLAEATAIMGSPHLVCPIALWSDRRYLVAYFVYPDTGVALVHTQMSFPVTSDSLRLSPEMPIARVGYFDPSAFETLLLATEFSDITAYAIPRCSTGWPGIGEEVPTIDF